MQWCCLKEDLGIHLQQLRRIDPCRTFSLSRNYVIPTYLILGLATAYGRIALADPPEELRMNRALAVRLALFGIGTLAFLKLFTQLLVRF